MLSGHTHGGQVELPWLTNYIMKKVSILGHKKAFMSMNMPMFLSP
jgi:predicted MPP superfamily phosphohydrolase